MSDAMTAERGTRPTGAEPATLGEESHRTKGLLRLTMACNERCPFCNVPMEDYARPTPPAAEIDAQLQAFLDDGAETLTISGGEPTLLRKRLVELVRRARAGGVRFVELQTNAVLLDDAYAAELADAGVTSAFVSLLSHVPERHDTLAGLEGAFPRCLRGIDAMLDHGIRVTLNPVTASLTQELVADYVDFVAARLPRVHFISLSAVQPHGRARDGVAELLPDYGVLGPRIREARARAEVHGLELVNPYCGLPLCIGWDDALDQCVEAFEARAGGWRDTHGLDNVGNKAHGEPCRTCALRTRCGGAWHAYWEVRDGAGIHAPITTVEPWFDGADHSEGQAVVAAPGGLDEAALARLDAEAQPTVWCWTDRLDTAEAARLLASGCTDLALELDSLDPEAVRPALRAVRWLLAEGARLQPQTRLRVLVGLRPSDATNPTALVRTGALCAALGVDGLRILSAAPVWRRAADLLRSQHAGLDVAAVAARPLAQGAR
ncbi:MAG: radical SAM protein [Alphaproteobacteria bacterium]|nr:radical SAM protein [Alphaproteobacteria bacterium]